ncbi:MAG: UTP--glucose-1-phosphate uridylyltransferase [Planctomycetota bacterium]|jgi:UDP-N-acetylglucosamine/UDP-N-acetylgalactosamine diphosphorylase
MVDENKLDNITKKLNNHDQGHLLAFWESLDVAQRQSLVTQIDNLDLDEIDRWVARFVKEAHPPVLPHQLDPPASYSPQPADAEQQRRYDRARELGRELISAGKVAPFVVAGGQGTRLGFDGPKGDFPITPLKNKTLFRVFAETIAEASRRYGIALPWYVMTSPLNHDQTRDTFRSNDYFGLDKNEVFVFQQGTLPNFGFDGRILLADKATIACSPDGHGGSLKALFHSGALAHMKERRIEFISYFQIDNPLVNIFDALFIGLHALDGAEMSSKAVVKTAPKEKVGNFCLADGKLTVIEYSDLPDELAEKRCTDGSLLFQLGSIAIHITNTAFVEKLNAGGFSLPLHRAVKKIPCVDESGNRAEPAEPNGIKLETFVFDALPLAGRSVILQTPRAEEFGPLKNATGTDSVETARQLIVARAADWLESAGVCIPRKPDGSPDCLIEIGPAFALERDDIKRKLNRIPEINPGDKLYLA